MDLLPQSLRCVLIVQLGVFVIPTKETGRMDNVTFIFEVSLGALDISWLHDTVVHPVVCESDVSYLPA